MRGFVKLNRNATCSTWPEYIGYWRHLPSKYIVPYFSEELADREHIGDMEASHSDDIPSDAILEGNIIKVRKNDDCSDVNTFNKQYKCIKSVDKLYDVDVDAYVVKNIEEQDTSTIFSLTKSDCKTLGIEFERGLEILPKDLDWMAVPNERQDIVQENEANSEEFPYDPEDLSTYPHEYDSGLIKWMTIKISGCEYYNRMHSTFKFCHKISGRRVVYDARDIKIKRGDIEVPYSIFAMRDDIGYTAVPYNVLYLELDLSHSPLHPFDLRGLKFEDLFTVNFFEPT